MARTEVAGWPWIRLYRVHCLEGDLLSVADSPRACCCHCCSRFAFVAALNRLLDSNRELLLPPTGALIKAHPDFQLFGTQNPAGLGVYGGRKVLSKALANRFVQLQLEEFGIEDLRLILTNRCKLPASRVDPMLKVFRDLQQRRANSSVRLALSSRLLSLELEALHSPSPFPALCVFFAGTGRALVRQRRSD